MFEQVPPNPQEKTRDGDRISNLLFERKRSDLNPVGSDFSEAPHFSDIASWALDHTLRTDIGRTQTMVSISVTFVKDEHVEHAYQFQPTIEKRQRESSALSQRCPQSLLHHAEG